MSASHPGLVRRALAVAVMYLASPLALGSARTVWPGLLLPVLIMARIRGEERLLADDLPGYRRYQLTTKFRLIPGIGWNGRRRHGRPHE